MEVDTDSLNETKKQEVETVEDKQAGKSQLGGSTVSQSMPNADTRPHLIPISVPDKSGESRKQPGRKYPLTSDKLSSCKPTTMEVDNDSLNRTKKHEVETVEDKQAGKSQLGGNSVSQIMPNAVTQPHLISKAISLPDTSGESRKLPGRKYPRTSDKLSSCKLTTMEVDTDSLNKARSMK
ncbi:hypothetical protein TNCT_519271 [Trichonephila clavata]|uniref:Uncharacterized protein n=1 Tax=Trichonephila clavata TaxID=2740835 RepID=A0A8X6KPR8_TRICU|nr:hypothetical protein TNCT_519271 [Trichonephila clavata]